jgi:hypothetical protein
LIEKLKKSIPWPIFSERTGAGTPVIVISVPADCSPHGRLAVRRSLKEDPFHLYHSMDRTYDEDEATAERKDADANDYFEPPAALGTSSNARSRHPFLGGNILAWRIVGLVGEGEKLLPNSTCIRPQL